MPHPENIQKETIVARHYDQLDSTNAEALRLLRAADKLPSGGSFITTDFQTAGRGQGQNGWYASAGQNFLGSLIYFPEQLPAGDLFALTQAASLAVVEVIQILTNEVASIAASPASQTTTYFHIPEGEPKRRSTASLDIRIKWPNDIYVNDRKIAGLLIQNSLQGSRVQWSVIGLGLNINEMDFPPELREKATSIALWNAKRTIDLALARNVILATSLAKIKHHLAPARRAEMRRQYHRLLYRLDETANYLNVAANQPFRGKIRGVDASGKLLVEHEIGRMQTYTLKEIAFI